MENTDNRSTDAAPTTMETTNKPSPLLYRLASTLTHKSQKRLKDHSKDGVKAIDFGLFLREKDNIQDKKSEYESWLEERGIDPNRVPTWQVVQKSNIWKRTTETIPTDSCRINIVTTDEELQYIPTDMVYEQVRSVIGNGSVSKTPREIQQILAAQGKFASKTYIQLAVDDLACIKIIAENLSAVPGLLPTTGQGAEDFSSDLQDFVAAYQASIRLQRDLYSQRCHEIDMLADVNAAYRRILQLRQQCEGAQEAAENKSQIFQLDLQAKKLRRVETEVQRHFEQIHAFVMRREKAHHEQMWKQERIQTSILHGYAPFAPPYDRDAPVDVSGATKVKTPPPKAQSITNDKTIGSRDSATAVLPEDAVPMLDDEKMPTAPSGSMVPKTPSKSASVADPKSAAAVVAESTSVAANQANQARPSRGKTREMLEKMRRGLGKAKNFMHNKLYSPIKTLSPWKGVEMHLGMGRRLNVSPIDTNACRNTQIWDAEGTATDYLNDLDRCGYVVDDNDDDGAKEVFGQRFYAVSSDNADSMPGNGNNSLDAVFAQSLEDSFDGFGIINDINRDTSDQVHSAAGGSSKSTSNPDTSNQGLSTEEAEWLIKILDESPNDVQRSTSNLDA